MAIVVVVVVMDEIFFFYFSDSFLRFETNKQNKQNRKIVRGRETKKIVMTNINYFIISTLI